jgi:hypothetical protein
MRSHPFFASFAVVLLAACSREQPVEPTVTGREAPSAPAEVGPARPEANPLRDAYFGAVHVHTSYSFDAFTNGTVSKPADAYEWAKGRPIRGNAAGLMLQIETPLDFYAVSDHAEMMGVFPRMSDPNDPLSRLPLAARVTSKDPNEAMQAFAGILRDMSAGESGVFTRSPPSR